MTATPGNQRDYLQWMVHSLEAQERTSIRMMDRATFYAVFSFTMLGVYVGVVFANSSPSNPSSEALLAGAFVMAALAFLTLVLFLWVHLPTTISVLSHPRVFWENPDLEGFPEGIIKAYNENDPRVKRDGITNKVILGLVSVQAFAFLVVTLIEIVA